MTFKAENNAWTGLYTHWWNLKFWWHWVSPQGKKRRGEKQVRAPCCPRRTREGWNGGVKEGRPRTEDAGDDGEALLWGLEGVRKRHHTALSGSLEGSANRAWVMGRGQKAHFGAWNQKERRMESQWDRPLTSHLLLIMARKEGWADTC